LLTKVLTKTFSRHPVPFLPNWIPAKPCDFGKLGEIEQNLVDQLLARFSHKYWQKADLHGITEFPHNS
jgi:hypothetical protein